MKMKRLMFTEVKIKKGKQNENKNIRINGKIKFSSRDGE